MTSPIPQDLLDFDRRCLADLGLKMPRCTPKYVHAVSILSTRDGVSPYFTHLLAARDGVNRLYKELKQLGYIWTGERWQEPD